MNIIIITNYRYIVEETFNILSKNKLHPVAIYQKTSKNMNTIIKNFKTNETINPLITTIQMMSTGVTLTEANTIIFLNKPWRYNEYQQASDRIHRIGQDTEVFIYTLLLDTDGRENLSTGMERVMEWSKEMFEHMMGEN